jgi:hypothetical protein
MVGEAPPTAAPGPPSAAGSGWTGGRIAGMVFSSLAALIGIALLLGGLALVGAYAFARDDDGYFSTSDEHLQSGAYALTAEDLDLGADPGGPAPEDLLGTVRIDASATDGQPIFIGIARTTDVDRYLGRAGHTEVVDFSNGSPRYEQRPGGAPRTPPRAQDIWVAQSEGAGAQRVQWDAESGVWSVVIMNADGSRGVSVDAEAGVKLGWVLWVGIGLVALGLLLTVAGVILILRIGRRASRDPAAA